MTTKTVLTNEIESQLNELKHLEVGSEEYKATVDGITKLIDRSLEIVKLEEENRYRNDALAEEMNIKQQQLDADKHDRKIKNILTGLSIGIPAGVSVWGTLKALKFEEIGTVTTLVGKTQLTKIFNLFKR